MKAAQPSLWMGLMDATARPGMGLRERLCAALRDAMRSGTLAAGARLPASRVLAQDLALSRVTVEAAYAQLEAEGYVVRRTGQGSFVALQAETAAAPPHFGAQPGVAPHLYSAAPAGVGSAERQRKLRSSARPRAGDLLHLRRVARANRLLQRCQPSHACGAAPSTTGSSGTLEKPCKKDSRCSSPR